jgi:hypothetical protein
MTYEIFSAGGRLLGETDSAVDAALKLARWHQAEFVIEDKRSIALVKEDTVPRHLEPADEAFELLTPCWMSE